MDIRELATIREQYKAALDRKTVWSKYQALRALDDIIIASVGSGTDFFLAVSQKQKDAPHNPA